MHQNMTPQLRIAAYQPDIAPNLASIIRTAACLQVSVDVIGPCGFPFSVKSYRRTVMDYEAQADVAMHVDWQSFEAQRKGRLILMTTAGAIPLWEHRFQPTDVLMVGRETAGVPESVARAADARVLIPMPGGGRSLNVAVSAAISMAEACRQLAESTRPLTRA